MLASTDASMMLGEKRFIWIWQLRRYPRCCFVRACWDWRDPIFSFFCSLRGVATRVI